MAKGKGGRPSKFDPRMIEEGRKLAAFGATDEEIRAARRSAGVRRMEGLTQPREEAWQG